MCQCRTLVHTVDRTVHQTGFVSDLKSMLSEHCDNPLMKGGPQERAGNNYGNTNAGTLVELNPILCANCD